MILTRQLLAAMALASGAAAQAAPFMQCGGVSWSGFTYCTEGYYCWYINGHFSQCIPNTSTTLSTSTTATATQTTTVAPARTDSGTSPGATLLPNWFWIRAVAPPNFHAYLQSKPTGLASPAYLDAASNAGQFNVIEGQLVYNTGEGGQLYLHVENADDKTQRKLETWFAEEKADYGTFGFQGDTLTWHVDDIARPNEAAWLVCEEQKLFVNTGAYAYDTPAGCADQTIHSYGGATADV